MYFLFAFFIPFVSVYTPKLFIFSSMILLLLYIYFNANQDHMYKPSGISPFFKYNTFSFACSKSFFVTFILLSLKAINPAYVHIALISAPDKSSFVEINYPFLT